MISTTEECFQPPRLPPKPPTTTPQSIPGSGKGRQNISSPSLGSTSDPPPKLPARPKREPVTSSCNALPLPPKLLSQHFKHTAKPPSTPQQKVFNERPPLPPRESTPHASRTALVASPAGIGRPPLPPKQEPVSSTPLRDSLSVTTSNAPVLPPKGILDLLQNPSCESILSMAPAPPVPPRGL